MKTIAFAAFAAGALVACETSNSDEWTGQGRSDFYQAERGCRAQTEAIDEVENRPDFFVKCMRALGWTPREGTDYATPETAPDRT